LEILEILLIALYRDPGICPRDIGSPLLHRLHNRKKLPIARVIVRFSRRAFSEFEIDWSQSSEPVILIEDAGDCEAAASVWRISGFAGSECCRIRASVRAFLNVQNANSASRVHSHFGRGLLGIASAWLAECVLFLSSSSVALLRVALPSHIS
jgi:hypothetical protein